MCYVVVGDKLIYFVFVFLNNVLLCVQYLLIVKWTSNVKE